MQGYTPKTPVHLKNLPRPPKARRRGLGYKNPVKYKIWYRNYTGQYYIVKKSRNTGSESKNHIYWHDYRKEVDFSLETCKCKNCGFYLMLQYCTDYREWSMYCGGGVCLGCGYKEVYSKTTGWKEYPKAKHIQKFVEIGKCADSGGTWSFSPIV